MKIENVLMTAGNSTIILQEIISRDFTNIDTIFAIY